MISSIRVEDSHSYRGSMVGLLGVCYTLLLLGLIHFLWLKSRAPKNGKRSSEDRKRLDNVTDVLY